jgi:biopolymer transport protein ExbD
MRTARRGSREIVQGDLDLMPLMNLFVAIIPMLLVSAVFINMSVIDMNAPADSAGDGATAENLALTVTIGDGRFVVEGRGIEPTTIERSAPDAALSLAGTLEDVAARFPGNKDVIVVSQPDTRYSDIVAVMDISRAAGLPSVSLLGAE